MPEFMTQLAGHLGAAAAAFPWFVVLIIYIGEKWQQVILTRVLKDALAKAQDAAHTPAAPPTTPPQPQPKPAPVPIPAQPSAPSPAPKPATEYDRMWAAMQVAPQHEAVVERDAAKIMANKAKYEGVSKKNGVPWFVIGMIDMMETGGGCKAHLHNGDPLEQRTIHVPAGRPPAPDEPPFTWEQSALDALHYEKFDQIKSWNVASIAGALERYNGMGYHNKGVPSPYLWSFSNQYTAGKFVADHVYDANAISQQAGAMPILKALMAIDPSINV